MYIYVYTYITVVVFLYTEHILPTPIQALSNTLYLDIQAHLVYPATLLMVAEGFFAVPAARV